MRRLPVINSAAPEDEAAASRPRWQWVLIGAGFTAVFWIPLALLLAPLAVPIVHGMTSQVLGIEAALAVTSLTLVVTYGVAGAGAGAVMGRFAPRARAHDAAAAAALSAAFLSAVAAARLQPWVLLLAFVLLAPVGAVAAYATARRFAARRSP